MAILLDSRSVRKQIKDIIEKHYKEKIEKDFGMIILKELIQNANDARANSLNFGFHKGFSESLNPLLKNSGLFFINDGEFKKSDLISINKMWDNAKGNNPNQIGKFGLGLKSIFHWCEAFFYFSSGISDTFKSELARKRYNDKFGIFNPWEPTIEEEELNELSPDAIRPYPEWDILNKSDFELFNSSFKSITSEMHNWFCIWIPLRKKKPLKKEPFKYFYPGDDKNFREIFNNTNLIDEIISILPLMSSLTSVSYWKYEKTLSKVYNLRNDNNFPIIERGKTNFISPINTETSYNNRSYSSNIISYHYDDNDEGIEIKKKEKFPKDEDGKEKAFQQGAVSLSIIKKENNDKGKIILDWCVFLPLSEERKENTINGQSIHLKLHGWFFIDSGRNKIDFGTDENSLTIEQEWNRLIAEKCTLPLLIPTLRKVLKDDLLSGVQFAEIINAIRGTDFYKLSWARESICSKYNVIRRVSYNSCNWIISNSDEEFYKIPSFDFQITKNTFLNKTLSKFIFVSESDHHTFGLSKHNCSSWSKEMYLEWLEMDIYDLITDIDLQKLWLKVMNKGKSFIQSNIIQFLKNIFAQLQWNILKKNSSFIKEINAFVDSKCKVYINLPDTFPIKYFQPLYGISTDSLLLNSDFYDTNEKSGEISENDCYKLIKFSIHNIDDTKKLSKLVLSLLRNAVKDKTILMANIKELEIFRIRDKNNSDGMCSWSSLVEIANNELLFSTAHGIYEEISQSLANLNIGKLLDHELSNILSIQSITPNIENFLSILSTSKPRLKSIEYRKSILTKIKNIEWDEFKIKAVRYLLHSKTEYFDNLSPIFILDNSSWSKLLFICLKRENKEWSIISEDIIKYFSANDLKSLNILNSDQDIVEGYLSEVTNLTTMDCSILTKNDISNLIQKFGKIEILKQLSIFENIQGKFVPVNNITFINNDFEIPFKIQSFATFLKPNETLEERGICEKLNPNSYLELLFEPCNSPENFWNIIIILLLKVSNISDELRDKLRMKNWVPLKKGKFCSFDLLIHIDDLEDIISSINVGDFYDIFMLSDSITNEKVWNKLNNLNLINSQGIALDIIASTLLQNNDNNFGRILENGLRREYDEFIEIFDIDDTVFPILRIINQIKEKCESEHFYNTFIPRFFDNNPSPIKLVSIFKFLQIKYNTQDIEHKKEVIKIFNSYLIQLNSYDKPLDILCKIQLLNVEKQWKPTNSLVFGYPNIKSKYKLNSDTAEIINNIIIKTEDLNKRDDTVEIFRPIEEYFKDLSEKIPPNPIGLFLSCLGDNPRYIKLANSFLTDGRSVESIRKNLNDTWDYPESEKKYSWHFNDINETMSMKQNWVDIEIEESDNTEFEIQSIVGDTFKILTSDLTIGNKLHTKLKNSNILFFKQIPNTFSEAENSKVLLKALYGSLLYVVKKHFCQPNADIEELWEKYTNADQLVISQVQRKIVNQLIFILQELKIDNDLVYKIFTMNDEIHSYETDGGRKNKEDLRRKLNRYCNEAFDDSNFATDVLEAIKKKLSTYQYENKSVISELFQNADDAVSELMEMDLEPEKDEFVVVLNNKTLSVMHWGRKINQDRGGSITVEQSQKRRYHDDILKILRIGYSGKDKNQTGKFGLGFKSIFFVTESPKILSGQLAFKISGAIYPSNLQDETRKRLREKMYGSRSGTIIDMDLSTDPEPLIREFEKNAYLQTIFANKISKIRINNKLYSNQLEELFGIEDVFRVKINNAENGLLLKSENGSILFRITAQGISAFPNDISSIWVTVPTCEKANLGYILNSKFDIDVGRTQLVNRKIENNLSIAINLSELFNKKIIELFIFASENWEEFKTELELSFSLTQYDFWESLFNVIMIHASVVSESTVLTIANHLMWGNDTSGYYGIIREYCIIPNDLAQGFKTLIALRDVENIISSELNTPELLPYLIKLDILHEKSISSITYESITSKFELQNIKEISLYSLPSFVSSGHKLLPDIANLLSTVYIKTIEEINVYQLKESYKGFRFQSQSHTWLLPNELFHANFDDYNFIKKIVPQNYLLSDSYSQDTMSLISNLTENQTNDILLDYIYSAKTQTEKINSLKYIAKYHFKFGNISQKSIWFSELTKLSPILNNLNDSEKGIIENIIKSNEQIQPDLDKYSFEWFRKIAEVATLYHTSNTDKSETINFSGSTLSENKQLLTLTIPNRRLLDKYNTAKKRLLSLKNNMYSKLWKDFNVPFKISVETNKVEILFEKALDTDSFDITIESIFKLKLKQFEDVSVKLLEGYNNLQTHSPYNIVPCSLKKELPLNIEFIFGPPGTGKTHSLAKIITDDINFLSSSESIEMKNQGLKSKFDNILILAPTNKAVDELFEKILSFDKECNIWASRFGNTTCQRIIDLNAKSDSSKERFKANKVTMTTAIRFPYDKYLNATCFKDTKWDYIIFDESSMIPIQYIIYIIHQAYFVNTKIKFIIAGDPLQIPPIYNFRPSRTSDDEKNFENKIIYENQVEKIEKELNGLEKDENENVIGDGKEINIYKMIKLDTFNPKEQLTEPHNYKIWNLTKQYRSVPDIVNIVGDFAYNNLLTSHRDFAEKPAISIDFKIGKDVPKQINVIEFPIIGGNIFHHKKINNTNVHPYSAILVSEIINYVSAQLSEKKLSEKITIGAMSPYKIQVDLIRKITNKLIPVEITQKNIDIQIDTVHGFQGGEKQIIFCVLNPPVSYENGVKITCSDKAHINKQHILNVAISRAKDYLFILVPENYNENGFNNEIPDFKKLTQINTLINKINVNQKHKSSFIHSFEIEKQLFNDKNYIHGRSFVSNHENVNVYDFSASKKEKKYLVFHDDLSIDIQINKVKDNVLD